MKKILAQLAVSSLILVSANCSGKTYSTFFQPFDLVFNGGSGGGANPAVTGSLIAATPLTNTRVMLTFSKPVTLSSGQNVANYRITAPNGNLLNILAVSRDPNNSNIIFIDTIPQAAGTQYTATVSGIAFVDGAALGNASATFTAPNNADQTGPQFSSVTALSATTVEVFFNEAVDLTRAQTFGNYHIRDGAGCTGANIAATAAVRDSANFAKVTLTTGALTSGRTYYVCGDVGGASGIRDIWGNPITGTLNGIESAAFVYSAPTPRVTSVTSTSPSSVLVTYSEDMDTTGVAGTALTNNANYTINQCSTAGTVSLNSAGTVVGTRSVLFTGVTSTGSGTCHLTVTIPGGTTCDTTAGLVCSAAGARLTTAGNTGVLNYNASNATDTTPPAVIGVTTTNSTTVVVTFSEPVTGVTAGDFNLSPALNITGVSCTGNVCTLTTDAQSTTPYSLSVTNTSGGIQDNATPPNTLSSGSTTFTGDGAPYIVAIYAVDSGTVMVQWSEPIGGSGTVNAADYSINGTALDQAPWSPGSSAALHLPDANDRSIYVKLTISPVLTDGTTYTLGVNTPTGSTDSSNNPTLNTVPNGGTFTGPSATTKPQLTSASSTGTTTVIANFNEPLNNANIDPADFTLTGLGCPTTASAAIQIAAGVVQLTVNSGNGGAGTSCTMQVALDQFFDLAGNGNAATVVPHIVYTYTGTGAADTTPPTIASVVSLSNTRIQVFFSEAMKTGANGMDTLSRYSTSPALTLGPVVTCANNTASCIIDTSAQSAQNYTLSIASGIEDFNSVPTTGTISSTFIGTGGSATAPTLFMATLINSTTVELSFSEAMNLATSQNTANYTVSGGNTVSAAVRQADTTKVRLTITPGAYGSSNTYTVTAAGVTDLSGNTIGTPNSATFSGSGSAPSTASLAVASDTGTVGDNITGVNLTSPGLKFTGNTTPNTTVVLYHSPGVSFTDAGDLVTLNSHGLANGTAVTFTTINSTTGIATNTTYYVINATANTFQLSTTPTGPGVVALTTDGTGILNTPIPYATAVSGPTGDYTVTVPSTATIPQGTNQFNIATVGPTGLVSDLSQTFSITYDSNAPGAPSGLDLLAVSDTGFSNTDDITNNTTPQIRVVCEVGARVQLYTNNPAPNTATGSLTTCSSSPLDITTGTLGSGAHTITAVQTDVAGNASGVSGGLTITIDTTAPTLSATSLTSNSYIDLPFSPDGVYGSANSPATPITLAMLNISFSAGTSGITISPTVTTTVGGALTGGETTVRVNLNVTGAPNGSETIQIASNSGVIFDRAGNVVSFDSGTKNFTAAGVPNITGTPTYTSTGATTGYITVVWDEAPYTAAAAAGVLTAADFDITFAKNAGGNANSMSITGFQDGTGGSLDAGETTMRILVSFDLATSGVETFRLNAKSGEIFSGINPYQNSPTTEQAGPFTAPDRLAPTITGVNSSTADGSYKAGDTISIQVSFSENVTVTGTPQLTLETGATDAVVNYASGSGTSTLTFTYTVASPHTSADLNANSLALNGGTINDAASNAANLTLSGTTLAANKNIVVDTTAPTITSVNSSTANGSYKAGDAISIQVNFSENVTVTGTPQLTLETGATDAVVNYVSGSGTSSLTFTYTVASPHTSSDLDANSLGLNGGTINDGAGNAATLTLAGTSLATNKNLVVDTTVPTITSVNSSTANGSYKAGDVISIQVNFSENVTVTGTPQLTLETGTTDAVVNYASGSGTSSLTFTYTIASPHTSSDLDANSLGLNGGTINDGAGNAATLTLAGTSLATNKNIVVDTTVPTITSVNSSTANGTYKIGDVISIQVNFSENVTVTGTPQLTLETGATDAVVNYASGSGTSALTFTYTIASPHVSADLDANSLALNGGTINDAAANAATLTLAGTSLATNKNLVVDGVAPTITSVNSSTADGSYKVGDVISIQVNFSENVTVTGTPQLTLETGATDAVVNYASGSGTSSLTFTYTIASPHTSADLDANSLGLNGGTINDAAGNPATLTLAGTSLATNKNIVVDTTVPLAPASIALDTADDTGTSNSDGVTKNTTNLTFSGTSEANATVRLYYPNTAGTLIGTATANGSGNWTLDNITLAENVYSIVATATDAANNVSSASSAYSLTIDTTAPTNQNTVYASSSSRAGGASQTIVSSGTASNQVWFAPSGTTTFTAGATMTQAGSGTATTINAPATAGSYKLFVIDLAGNISSESTATLTVDNTAPTISSVAPATNAYVNNTQVSFTFSEAVTSGSVTWTRTGGTADGSSPHVQALTGGELATGAHSAITLTNNPTLVSGTIYTITWNATDAAGNAATAVTSTNVTYDTTLPVISAVSPASSSSVNNTGVSYTLSEVCQSGSITWTRTGGTADGSSPHTRALTGSELNAGTFTGTITNNPTLVDGTIYSVAFNCTDRAGNVATTVTSTNVTYSPGVLAITTAETMDTDNDGKIDTYRVSFNKPVNDSTFPGYSANALGSVTTYWLVAGYTNVRLIHGSAVTFATDTANDATIYIRFDENVQTCSSASQVGCDTDAKPDLTTTAVAGDPRIEDLTTAKLGIVSTGTVTESDASRPVLIAARSLSTTTADAIFSEPVDTTTAQTATNYTISGGSAPTVSAATRDGTNTNIVHLTTGTQTGGQAYTLTVNTNVKDLANLSMNASANTANFNGVQNPVVSSVVTASATTLTITFNETVTAASTECTSAAACALIYDNTSIPILSAVSTGGTGVNSATFTLTVNPMVEGQSYTLTVLQNTVTSVATGNKMLNTNNSATFNGDGKPAATISTDTATTCPAAGADQYKKVIVQYDQAVSATALTATNYKITGCVTGTCSSGATGANTSGAATVTSLGGNKYEVKFTDQLLLTTALFQMTISGVQDTNSNTIAAPGNLTFQCGSDSTKPMLAAANVVTATAGSTVVLLSFSEAIDNVTGNVSTNYKYDAQAYGANVQSAARQSNTAQVLVTFQPALANGGHQIRVQNVQDLVANAIDDNGVTNVQPIIVNAPTGFSGGPVFTDPFADGTPAGQMILYDDKIVLGWDGNSSKFFEMNKSLTVAQTITLDADGNSSLPAAQFKNFLTTVAPHSNTIDGLDAISAGCVGGTATPKMTGTACSGAGGTEYVFAGGFSGTAYTGGNYRTVFRTTDKSSSTTKFTFTELGGLDSSNNTYRSMTTVLFREYLYVASPHRGANAPRVSRICARASGNCGNGQTPWGTPLAINGHLFPRVGKQSDTLPNSANLASASNVVSIDTALEYDNDATGTNASQLYIANGGRFMGTLGGARNTTNRVDGGILRSRLGRSTSANPPGCAAGGSDVIPDAATCTSTVWEDITPSDANWGAYVSIPMPFLPLANTDWANMLPANRIIPAIKAVPYMREAPNGDLYMLRNACATTTMQTVCSNGPTGACDNAATTLVNNNFTADFATTANGRRQVCPPGYEVPQLWVLPKNPVSGGTNRGSSDWVLVASRTFTPQTYPNGSALPSRTGTTLSGNTGTCGTAPNNKCERNVHATLLEFVGSYLYIGFDNQDHGANIWRVDMNSATCTGSAACTTGLYPAEASFQVVNNVLGLDNSATNQRIFSHLTVNDSGKDWLILATRDGTNAMKIYRTANDQN